MNFTTARSGWIWPTGRAAIGLKEKAANALYAAAVKTGKASRLKCMWIISSLALSIHGWLLHSAICRFYAPRIILASRMFTKMTGGEVAWSAVERFSLNITLQHFGFRIVSVQSVVPELIHDDQKLSLDAGCDFLDVLAVRI